MAIPKPDEPGREADGGRPIMAALDLLGRRWVMRIIWELRGGPQTFRALRERCDDMSPTVLNQRLRELRDAAIVDMADEGYALSQLGGGLLDAMGPMLAWSERWQQALAKDHA